MMENADQNRLIHGVFSSINEYQAYLKTVPVANLHDGATTLRISEADIHQRLKDVNAELRRRYKKARP